MKSLPNSCLFVGAMAIIVAITASSRADETAVSFNDSSIVVGTSGWGVFGWQFSTSSDIEVTSLGLYDYLRGDGLAASHAIGIWDISAPSQPLVSTIIPAGNVAPLAQDFRYAAVSPVILPAGQDYVIGALYKTDDYQVGALNAPNWQLTVGSGLQFDGYRYGALESTTLAFPEGYIPGQQETFGPNFTYEIVPEPPIWSLCALGVAVLSFSRKIMHSAPQLA